MRVSLSYDYDRRRWQYVVYRPVHYEGTLMPDPRLPDGWPGGLHYGENGRDAASRHEAELDKLRQVAAEQLLTKPAEIGWEQPC